MDLVLRDSHVLFSADALIALHGMSLVQENELVITAGNFTGCCAPMGLL